ncbi:PucR family transcriptional regulator [Streptomyces venezuelae]|uniref:PucR family transcriptional regulator n=1 Tax=Streptomyces venezuelae TaxID=54571 RepID=UPI003633F968
MDRLPHGTPGPADHVRRIAPDTASPQPPGADVLADAAGLLLGRVAPLAQEALTRIRSEVIHYGSRLLAPTDAAESAHLTLEIAVRSLSRPSQGAASGEHAWSIGHQRASEGLPLLAVLQAYRIGASVLWDGLVETAMTHLPDRAHTMVHAANAFWRHVDRDTTLMLEGHRQVTEQLPHHDGRRLLPALRALLRGHTDPLDLSAAAVALDLPLIGRYAVVRLSGVQSLHPVDGAVREEVDGIQLTRCPQPDGQAVLALLQNQPVGKLLAAVAAGPDVRGGVSPVVGGLAELGRARELAELALKACKADGEITLLHDRMPTALILARPDLAAELAATVLGPLTALDAADRELLVEALEAWIDCQGSAGRAGERLYCHRNTVFNRLRRLERLTGKFLDRPRDLVELTLALDAYRRAPAER